MLHGNVQPELENIMSHHLDYNLDSYHIDEDFITLHDGRKCGYARARDVFFGATQEEMENYINFWDDFLEPTAKDIVDSDPSPEQIIDYRVNFPTKNDFVSWMSSFHTYAVVLDTSWLTQDILYKNHPQGLLMWLKWYQDKIKYLDPDSWIVVLECHI